MPKASASVTVSARKLSILLAAILLFVILSISAYRSVSVAPPAEYQKALVSFGGKQFQVELADTNQKRMKGLGGRDDILPNEGMLFVFEEDYTYCFWMKDVDFPLDIFWLDANYEVIDLEPSADPSSYPDTFCPSQPVRYVLELKGGVGDSLTRPLKLTIEQNL